MSWCGDSGGTHKTHIMWIEWFKLASYLGPVIFPQIGEEKQVSVVNRSGLCP